jgi:gamma-glutamylcyclotransferase (GGCT)/AIG2-like uncharacterized protein YtfP
VIYLFAYGILKERRNIVFANYSIQASMFDTGSYPAIAELNTDRVATGNIIEVSQSDLKEFDAIEGVPFLYRRETIKTPLGDTFIYIYQGSTEYMTPITVWNDNNWFYEPEFKGNAK